jgi:hypothetical protein
MNPLAKLSFDERRDIWLTMKRHPIGPVELLNDAGFWRLIGRDILDDISRAVHAEALARLQPANPDWDDSACMGSAFDFVGWMNSSGFGRFLDDPDPDGYEGWLAMRMNLGLNSGAERRADARALRERGWRKPRGKAWARVRPEPRVASGSLVAKPKDMR